MTEADPQGDRDAARLLADEREFSSTLDRVARALATELDLGAIVQRLTDEATAVVGAEFGAFFYNVAGEGGEKYMLYTLSGVPKEKFSRFPMPRNTAVFAPTFAGDGVVRFDDVTADYRYGNNPPYRGMPEGHLPVRSYLAAPVVSRDGTVHGGLFFGHGRARVFGERAERIVVALAAHAAIAIDNARLFRDARRAEGLVRGLLDSMPELAWTARADGFVDLYNRRWYEYTGATPEEAKGWGWRRVQHPEHVEAVTRRWRQSLASGEPFEMEFPLRGADGAYRWFLTRVRPVRDEAGKVVRWYGTNTDVDAQRRARDAQAFLAKAGELLAASLDVERTIEEVTELAVPHVADWCAVDLCEDGGSFRRAAVAHVDPAKVELAWRLWRERPARLDDPGGAGAVVRTGQSEFMADIPVELLEQGVEGAQLEIMRSLALRSYMCVPLRARGRVLGAVSFVAAESGRRYGADDLTFAEELGRRAGLALDNARLHRAAVEAKERAELLAAEVAEQCRAMEAVLEGERERRRRLEERLARAGLAGPADE